MATDVGRFQKIQKTRSYEAIVDQIRQQIDAGVLRPGDRLPPERDLALALSVSRATLREAFRVLEHTGLVESRIGQGRFVAELRHSSPQGNLPSEALEEAAILDFLEVRRALEVPMAGLAAERASEEDLAQMEQALDMPPEEDETGLNSDSAFHLGLARASRNVVYTRFVSSELFLLYRLAMASTLLPLRRTRTNVEHRGILDAIRRHDRSAAEMAVRSHIDNIEQNLREILSEGGAGSVRRIVEDG